jgi:hypothetical protein
LFSSSSPSFKEQKQTKTNKFSHTHESASETTTKTTINTTHRRMNVTSYWWSKPSEQVACQVFLDSDMSDEDDDEGDDLDTSDIVVQNEPQEELTDEF